MRKLNLLLSLSLKNDARHIIDWIQESALSRCDPFGRWLGSYAKDLHSSYFSKTFLEKAGCMTQP